LALSASAHGSPKLAPLCGLSGTVEERVASCANFLSGRGELKDVQAGWSLVTQFASGFRIYRDDETGRLWGQPLLEDDYSHKEAAMACGSLLFNQGLRDGYPAQFTLPSLADFREAASHKLSDAMWLFWSNFWASDLSPDSERAAYYSSSTGKTGFLSRDRFLHFFNVMKALCVSYPTK
jgi:hypothetical protein